MRELYDSIAEFVDEYQTPINIVLIVIGAVLLHWALRLVLRYIVNRIVKGVKRSQTVELTEELSSAPKLSARAVQRTRTLGTVGRHIITWIIVSLAIILVLGELGLNLGALLASAGIIAAVLAFGAQNLVKDLLNGIFMVSEDQLAVGDWVTIGSVSGRVEDVGIRVTQIRAVDGTLWFVRNGEVLTLGNSSKGWGRALIDITLSAEKDLVRVEEVALRAARSLIDDPDLTRRISGEPEVWSVESAYGDRATLRLAMRTRPEAQWAVQRALRLVLIEAFEREGITLATELPNLPGANT